MGTTKIWIDKDLPYDERQLVAFLLNIRMDCIERKSDKLEKEAIYVDKETFSLYYYDEFIIGLSILDKELQWEFGEDWSSYLCEGNFEELKNQYSQRIAKGGGKGKYKSKSKQNDE